MFSLISSSSVALWLILPLFSLCAFVLSLSFLHLQRIIPSHPLQRHNTDEAADIRQPVAAFSGISRATRTATAPIQRIAPLDLPVISADLLHNLQIVQ